MRKKTKRALLRYSLFGALLLLLFCGAFIFAARQEINQPGTLGRMQDNLQDNLQDSLSSTAEAQAQARRLKERADQVIDGTIPRLKRLVFLRDAVKAATATESTCSFDRISPQLTAAIVAVEDSHFYEHHGFDPKAIARAALVNLQYGQVEEGASTITQQLVKNLFLSHERTLTRKLDEFALALDLELHYSKEEILTLYLNSIYFGSGFYGIEDAALGYFGKTPDKLTLAEAAMLAGLPNAPSLYSPYEDFHLAKKRQFIVLDAMVRTGAITDKEAMSAKIEPLYLAR